MTRYFEGTTVTPFGEFYTNDLSRPFPSSVKSAILNYLNTNLPNDINQIQAILYSKSPADEKMVNGFNEGLFKAIKEAVKDMSNHDFDRLSNHFNSIGEVVNLMVGVFGNRQDSTANYVKGQVQKLMKEFVAKPAN